jgi:hypothetical protein
VAEEEAVGFDAHEAVGAVGAAGAVVVTGRAARARAGSGSA